MKCPTCRRGFHPQADAREAYYFEGAEQGEYGPGFAIAVQLCPSCSEVIVILEEGEVGMNGLGHVYLSEAEKSGIIYPKASPRPLPEEVPEAFTADFDEACQALEFSPKASAALSRRLLQKVFRESLGIKKRNLSHEIDAFLEESGAPAFLCDAVDAVRSVGNFAAHPLKNTNTGEIVEVEPGEAEWLLDVLESLYDFVFVQPKRLRERREALNQKLRDLGKPELKGRAGTGDSD